MVAAASDRIPRVPPYSGSAPKCILSCLYGPFTLYGLTFQTVPVPTHTPLTSTPTTPITPQRHGFGLLPFRSPLLRKSMFLSFPAGTKMFQFPAFALHKSVVHGIRPCGFPHSDTHGSSLACRSPWIFAARCVLLRFRKPRHPPFALLSFSRSKRISLSPFLRSMNPASLYSLSPSLKKGKNQRTKIC